MWNGFRRLDMKFTLAQVLFLKSGVWRTTTSAGASPVGNTRVGRATDSRMRDKTLRSRRNATNASNSKSLETKEPQEQWARVRTQSKKARTSEERPPRGERETLSLLAYRSLPASA
jgi:hypothetical protein